MGLGNVCGEFDVLGVERFLADLRTYGKGDNHPQQAVIARMIELSEDFLSSQSPDIYTELEKAVKTTYDLLLLDWYYDGRTRTAKHLLEFVVQDFGPRL